MLAEKAEEKISPRTLKTAWWLLKDYRDELVHGPTWEWTDKVAKAREIQKILDQLGKYL